MDNNSRPKPLSRPHVLTNERPEAVSADTTHRSFIRPGWRKPNLLESTVDASASQLTSTLARLANSVVLSDDELKQIQARAEHLVAVMGSIRSQGASHDASKKKINELEKLNKELKTMLELDFLLTRVNPAAQKMLRKSEDFRKKFFNKSECNSLVMSVDIRRSTELMLKSRSPEKFSDFITLLCSDLIKIITDNYGVVDKFTGDGVLAFFPDFYSGRDAGLYAVRTAAQCHTAFNNHYKSGRGTFLSVLTDVGLGIGIDYGKTQLVHMAGGLTVVGAPVVYACRLAGAPAGKTYLNQPAYEEVSRIAADTVIFNETSLDIKHEGSILAYDMQIRSEEVTAQTPEWDIDES